MQQRTNFPKEKKDRGLPLPFRFSPSSLYTNSLLVSRGSHFFSYALLVFSFSQGICRICERVLSDRSSNSPVFGAICCDMCLSAARSRVCMCFSGTLQRVQFQRIVCDASTSASPEVSSLDSSFHPRSCPIYRRHRLSIPRPCCSPPPPFSLSLFMPLPFLFLLPTPFFFLLFLLLLSY